MSCGDHTRPVNPEQLGVPGRWVRQHHTPTRGGCRHTWQYRNTLGIPGGPVAKVCTGCGETSHQAWVAEAARPALEAAVPYLVGEAEWADLLRDKGAA